MKDQATYYSLKQPVLAENRRNFLVGTIGAITGAISLLLGVPSIVYLFLPRRKSQESRWIDAGDIASLSTEFPQEVTFRRNRVDGWKIHSEKETVWLDKTGSGKLVAFSPWCTHLGCVYRWESPRNEFSCPCHGSRFDREGQVITGPANRPLDRHELKIEGKRIWLGPLESSARS